MTAPLRFGSRTPAADRALVVASVGASEPLEEWDAAVDAGADLVEVSGDGRLVPIVAQARQRHPDLVIGVRTGLARVAGPACAVGADLLGVGADPELAEVAAEHGVGVACPADRAERMVELGVPKEGILVDAEGAGHGLELLRRRDELVTTGWPVLMTLSGGELTGEGALAAVALAAADGVKAFRAHGAGEVAAVRRTVDMVASILGTRPPARCVRGLA
ncbi:dihydropteroate synthase [Pseudonocardia acaciae]|uniref:dihydropteroate synthase n=1 Tax=Pseudonocardia acaciae TaxID=551276 RepID=UPI001FDF3919|nr:dihydropteroate synthase [Pseudonocardia acaciae]